MLGCETTLSYGYIAVFDDLLGPEWAPNSFSSGARVSCVAATGTSEVRKASLHHLNGSLTGNP